MGRSIISAVPSIYKKIIAIIIDRFFLKVGGTENLITLNDEESLVKLTTEQEKIIKFAVIGAFIVKGQTLGFPVYLSSG